MDIERTKRIIVEIEGRQWEILLQSKEGQVTFDTLILLMFFIPDGALASVLNSLFQNSFTSLQTLDSQIFLKSEKETQLSHIAISYFSYFLKRRKCT